MVVKRVPVTPANYPRSTCYESPGYSRRLRIEASVHLKRVPVTPADDPRSLLRDQCFSITYTQQMDLSILYSYIE